MAEPPPSIPSFKVVIVGSTMVGKSSIVRRLVQDAFGDENSPTCGADFYTFSIPVNNTTVNLRIWDTAGQERFRSVSKSHFRNAAGAVLVYDVTSLSSFDDLITWLNELQTLCLPNAYILLVGNKADLEADREVGGQLVKEFSDRHRLEPMETSAMYGNGVKDAFTRLAWELVNRNSTGQLNTSISATQIVPAPDLKTEEESSCC
jgi:small GTP-binding protein